LWTTIFPPPDAHKSPCVWYTWPTRSGPSVPSPGQAPGPGRQHEDDQPRRGRREDRRRRCGFDGTGSATTGPASAVAAPRDEQCRTAEHEARDQPAEVGLPGDSLDEESVAEVEHHEGHDPGEVAIEPPGGHQQDTDDREHRPRGPDVVRHPVAAEGFG